MSTYLLIYGKISERFNEAQARLDRPNCLLVFSGFQSKIIRELMGKK